MSKQLILLHTLMGDMNADRYVSTLAFFDSVHSEIPFSFVVTDNTTIRQYDNAILTPQPPAPSTALTLI